MLKKLLDLFPTNQITDECHNGRGLLMTRYYLTPKIFGCRLVIHQFHRSDNDRHYHDHPWNFISLILKGSYIEHFPCDGKCGCDIQFAHRRFSLIHRKKEWKHWVELPELLKEVSLYDPNGRVHIFEECWTLVLFYGKRREWGFWTEQGWIKHDKYDCRGNYANNPKTKDGHDGSMRAY